MKRLAYILASLMLLTACAGESFETDQAHNGIVDGMLKVDFTVTGLPFRTDTKAFGISPDIRSMKVVVFDEHGVYISQCDAELTDVTTSDNVATGKYSANFPVSEEQNAKRIIHFLVNYTDEIDYGTELEVISKLVVSDKTDCYWQRVEVTDLTAVEQDGKMVLRHQSQLQGINLIRNFCAFTVSTNPSKSNLEILSAAIYNVPDRGTVAPYSSDNSSFVGGSGFVNDYQSYTDPGKLIEAGYKASVPIKYGLTDYSSDDVLTGVDSEKQITLFSYERENPLSDPPFILVSGRWGTDESARASAPVTYYKVNLRDINDEYFPLLRNFRYKINIKEVKRAGSTNIEEALASIGSGEVSTDIRYSGLTDISNGEARMMVTTTEVVLVSDAPYKELLYKFFPNVNDVNPTPSNGDVTVTLGESGSTGSVFESISSIVVGADNSEGWRQLTCNPRTPGDAVRTQSVILTGTYTVDAKTYTISRTVNFTLRQKPDLKAQCLNASTMQPTTVVAGTKETPFVLRIGIPNGLPSSIFPIDLSIEAQQGTISPNTSISDNILPISSGKSLFGTDKPGFSYTKSIQYNAYESVEASADGYKYFDAYFKTNIAASSTDIIVTNRYFLPAITYFTNGEAKTYKFLPTAIEQTTSSTATLSFNMYTVTPVTINLGTTATPSGINASSMVATGTPGVYTYTPASTGQQQIGLVLDENAGYRITLSAANYDNAVLSKKLVWADTDRSDNNANDWIQLTGYDVTRENQPVIGQRTRLTVYIGDNHTENNVKINGITATRITSGTGQSISKEGETCNAYYIDYTPSVGPGRTEQIVITVAGDKCGTFDLPVWGITVDANHLTSVNHSAYSSGKYYVLVNTAYTDYHLYSNADNNTIAGRNTSVDYYSLFGFTNSGSPSTVFVPGKNKFVLGTRSDAYSLSDTGTSYVFTYNNGYTFMYDSWFTDNYNRYWEQTSNIGAVAMGNNQNKKSYFYVYPVTLVRP